MRAGLVAPLAVIVCPLILVHTPLFLPHPPPPEAAVVFLTDGQFRITDDDGTSRDSSAHAGTVDFGSAPIVHRTANVGDETAGVLTVEVFARPPARGPVPSPPGEVLLENEMVFIFRAVAQPGHAVRIPGTAPSVVIALDGGVVSLDGSDRPIERGGACWCEAETCEIRSRGGSPFEAIVVTLKPR